MDLRSSGFVAHPGFPLVLLLGILAFRPPFDAHDTRSEDSAAGDREPVEPPVAESWLLAVRHPEGSLEAAVQQVRRRNLAVSSGVL